LLTKDGHVGSSSDSGTGSALNQIHEAQPLRQEHVAILDVSHDVQVVGRALRV